MACLFRQNPSRLLAGACRLGHSRCGRDHLDAVQTALHRSLSQQIAMLSPRRLQFSQRNFRSQRRTPAQRRLTIAQCGATLFPVQP